MVPNWVLTKESQPCFLHLADTVSRPQCFPQYLRIRRRTALQHLLLIVYLALGLETRSIQPLCGDTISGGYVQCRARRRLILADLVVNPCRSSERFLKQQCETGLLCEGSRCQQLAMKCHSPWSISTLHSSFKQLFIISKHLHFQHQSKPHKSQI